VQIYRAGNLFESASKRWKERIGLRDDVEVKLLILEVPGSASGPGCGFVILGALDARKIIIPEPLDAWGEVFRGFDRVSLYFLMCLDIHNWVLRMI